MELTTIKLPKVLVDHTKTLYNLEKATNRDFVRMMLLSNLPDKQVELLTSELEVSYKEIKKIKNKRKSLLIPDGNTNQDPNTPSKSNKRLENMLNKTEFTNQLLLAYVKLLLSDTGYSYPKDIQEKLDAFESYDEDIAQILAQKFKGE